jgi:hypothetical protein
MILTMPLKIFLIDRHQWIVKSNISPIKRKTDRVNYFSFSPYEIRAYNDQLLQLERAFLNPLGQGGDYADMK